MTTESRQRHDAGIKPRLRKTENPDALTVSVDRAAELLGISRNAAYEAVGRGEIPALRFGKRIRVPKAALQRLLERAAPHAEGAPA